MQTASGSNTKPSTSNGTDPKKILANYAVKGVWPEVVDIYKRHPELHDAQITRTKDTALHVAVSSGQEDKVRELVDIISKTGDAAKKAVKVQNERGNTPLHLAAAMGNVEMCKLIAEVDVKLITDVRNSESETPFFVAALNGKKDAFICLHDLIIPGDDENAKTVTDYPYCRRSRDGQTILHVAIEGEYFDLAYQIMCRYDDLRNSVTVQGHTPLHILAKNTSAFRSQMYLGWFQKIIYLCTPVDELKFTKPYDKPTIVKNFDEEKSPNHPENYQTCINLYRLFSNAFKIFFRRNNHRRNNQHKQADPKRQADPERQDQDDHPMFPANYQICYELIKLFLKSALIILGVGSREIRKIQRKREKHTWSVQIMNKLLENSSRQYEYLDNGQKPVGLRLDEDMFTAGIDEEHAPDKGTPVDELKFTKPYDKPTIVKNFDEEKSPNHPENYQTCINLYRLFSNAFKIFFRRNNHRRNNQHKQADPKRQADPERQDQDDHPMFPANYQICYELIKLFLKSALIILGVGSREIRKIQRKREKHTWSVQIMNKLLENSSRQYEYLDNGQKPVGLRLDEDMFTAGIDEEHAPDKGPEIQLNSMEKLVSSIAGRQESIFKEIQAMRDDLGKIAAIEIRRDMEGWESPNTNIEPESKNETAILLAAKNGIKEMVEKILNAFPRAIDDTNADGKNIVLLAVETRQPHIYKLLLDRNVDNESVFRRVDNYGNSALHLAAKLGNYRPWLVSGAALQMQWEYKWYEFVKNSMPLHFFIHRNKKGETPRHIFTDTHKDLVKSSGEWLTNTSQSCSVVAALIAGVGFATVSAVPGGLKDDNSGRPVLENKLPFDIFSIAALVALCSSVTALVIFLAILTSRYQEKDFLKVLPRRLLFGLSSIFVSICAMLVSFSAGHFFVLKDSLKYMALPVYAITCFPVTVFAMAQFPLYFDLIKAKFTGLPQRRQKVVA
ncbi:Ankyrin repeat-containing protein [Actinidia chinensis var. chinensis]|uniref:Ankyrin repeat-containing protein n=1 Tax=Actinidia chinensis var. chinensis TaxID=1590841 RepID=A0A2R6QE02_ACTCC|nr:Ankyrin repeat-containing protein [Actinidia chinensis var. chinensis]